VNDANLGVFVDATRFDAFDVLGQPNNAVAIRALQVSLRHELRHFVGILLGKPLAGERILNELLEFREGVSGRSSHRVKALV
jgi:hypothetical protein